MKIFFAELPFARRNAYKLSGLILFFSSHPNPYAYRPAQQQQLVFFI